MPASERNLSNPYLVALPEDPSDRDEQPDASSGQAVEEVYADIIKAVAAELSETADPRGSAKKKRPPVLTPKRPGLTGTARDWDNFILVLEEQVRREQPTWSDSAVHDEAEARFTGMAADRHPKFISEYVKLMQVSSTRDRRFIRENIQIAACRRVPEMVELERVLRGHRDGRPTNRVLPLAMFERCALADIRPELRNSYEAFSGSNLELDWAYFDSPDMNVNREHMREESVARKTMKAMLERHDPGLVIDANLAVLKRMAERHQDEDGFTDVGRYLVIDGTAIRAHVDQIVPVNPEHEAAIVKNTGAKFGFHGGRNRNKKHWVGWTYLAIMDLATGLFLIGMLIPANEREFPYVTVLLDELFKRAPWIDPQYLVGDSEFDSSTRLAYDLEQRYGIHPVFELRETVGPAWDWAATKGVPQCSKHGAMKLQQPENFAPESVSRRYARDFEQAKRGDKARLRWYCDSCRQAGDKITATTYPKRNARIYTYLPRGGDHRNYATRLALMRRRNAVEGLFSTLKRRGIGAKAHHKAAWVNQQVHMEWLIHMALFGKTLRREVHETDLYEQCAEEAWELGLTKIKPMQPKVPPKPAAAAAAAA